MRAKKKETVIRQLKLVDAALTQTNIDGLNRMEKFWTSVLAVMKKPSTRSSIITILVDVVVFWKRNNFNPDGTRKKRSLFRVIKLAGYTLWSLVKIYLLINPLKNEKNKDSQAIRT